MNVITVPAVAQMCHTHKTGGTAAICHTVNQSKHAMSSARTRNTRFVKQLQRHGPCCVRTITNATQSSQQEQPSSRHDLEVELQDAIRLEQYQKAAELRDALKSLQPQDTAFSLKKQLDALVVEERFEVCASVTLQLLVCTEWPNSI